MKYFNLFTNNSIQNNQLTLPSLPVLGSHLHVYSLFLIPLLIYYKQDLISKKLEENVISSIEVTDNVYIIKKINNIVYLYRITQR